MTNETLRFECGCRLDRCHSCPDPHWVVAQACAAMSALLVAHLNLVSEGKLDIDEAGANVAPHLLTQLCESVADIDKPDRAELLAVAVAVRDQIGFELLTLERLRSAVIDVDAQVKEAFTRMHLQD